jgi:predicted O-methyltransferase YrrM
MNEANIQDIPSIYGKIQSKSEAIGFTMPSDLYVGSLLKTLISSKPGANVLELGTGMGMSLSWMIEGMDAHSTLTTIDNNTELIAIANTYFGKDKWVNIICEDGATWIQNYEGPQFDVIFADAWPGKYSHIDAVLKLIKIGGFYIIDDMMAQRNWPENHYKNVEQLIGYLESRKDFSITKMNWSTGIVIAVRR